MSEAIGGWVAGEKICPEKGRSVREHFWNDAKSQ